MAGGTNDASGRMMSFVSEKEVVEMRKKRQEQWERVRKPGEPKERPVEAYDPRPLYERLKEQREKEDEIREEKFKLKNMIYKGLDDEEAGFLNNVAYQQTRRDQLLIQKERDEINAFRVSSHIHLH
jgi:DNA invertase Pin-like site-specific DNA recombinase